MPARDGTGPEGRGAMTGRGLGDCNDLPAYRASLGDPSRLSWFGRLFRRRRAGSWMRGRGNRRMRSNR